MKRVIGYVKEYYKIDNEKRKELANYLENFFGVDKITSINLSDIDGADFVVERIEIEKENENG